MVIRHLLPVLAVAALAACEEPWAAEDLTALGTPVEFASVSVGWARSCGLDTRGKAWCWGQGTGSATLSERCFIPGDFATPDENAPCSKRPAPVAGDRTWQVFKIGGVGNTTWGIDDGGALWAFGTNSWFLVSDVDANAGFSRLRPVAGLESRRFRAVDASTTTACAVTVGGELFCWGAPNLVTTSTPAANQICPGGGFGGCGISPLRIGTATDWVDVGVGTEHACALNGTGRIYCWGFGNWGQLGVTATPTCRVNGFDFRCSTAPLLVSNAITFASVSAEGDQTCGRTTTNVLYCWGNMTTGASVLTPTQYATDVAQVDVFGWPGFCYVRTTGAVLCSAIFSASASPTQVSLPTAMVAVAGSRDHACVVNAAGDAWCVGDKSYGQLGDGTNAVAFTATPYQVAPPFKY